MSKQMPHRMLLVMPAHRSLKVINGISWLLLFEECEGTINSIGTLSENGTFITLVRNGR